MEFTLREFAQEELKRYKVKRVIPGNIDTPEGSIQEFSCLMLIYKARLRGNSPNLQAADLRRAAPGDCSSAGGGSRDRSRFVGRGRAASAIGPGKGTIRRPGGFHGTEPQHPACP